MFRAQGHESMLPVEIEPRTLNLESITRPLGHGAPTISFHPKEFIPSLSKYKFEYPIPICFPLGWPQSSLSVVDRNCLFLHVIETRNELPYC